MSTKTIRDLIEKAHAQGKLRYAPEVIDFDQPQVMLELNRTGMSGVEFVYNPQDDTVVFAIKTIDGEDIEPHELIAELAVAVGEDVTSLRDHPQVRPFLGEGFRENKGEFDDEFPDEHSHTPQEVDANTLAMHFADEEGRHYYLQHRTTDEGVIVDVFDRYGEEVLATFAPTWSELGNIIMRDHSR